MPRIEITIPPGLKRAGTARLSQGRWYEANLMRFYEGARRPVGGWTRVTDASGNPISVVGIPRALITWRDNKGGVWLGIGTNSRVYAYSEGNLYDLTDPGTRTEGPGAPPPKPPPNPTGVPYGNPTKYGSPSPYGGTMDQEPDPDPPPPPPPPPPSGPLVAGDDSVWSFDTFGEWLVGVLAPSDGKLRVWKLDPEEPMVEAAPSGENVEGAPIDNRAVVVTPERFVMLLGAGGDSRKVAWCSQEDILDWDIAGTGTAGEFHISTHGRLVAGLRTPRETLLWTDVDLHSAVYIGGDLVYSFERRGSACGLISPTAYAAVGDGAYWMSDGGFFSYFGSVNTVPCEVHDYVYTTLNRQYKKRIAAWHNSQYGEVWWFYPGDQSPENNRYVVYNYREGHWNFGRLSRTAGVDRGGYEFPLTADQFGRIYEHEKGSNRDGLPVYAFSGPIELGAGDRTMMVREIIPDNQPTDSLNAYLIFAFDPLDTERIVGPISLSYPTPVRISARYVRLGVFEAVPNQDWRLGDFRLEVVPEGER